MPRTDLDASAINLNQLRVLEALVELRSVSLAAQRLGVTQSAVSHALRQLRELFEDPLLVRGRSGMMPTPRAERLAQRLQRGFAEIAGALAEETSFDPATATNHFTVAAWDHMAAVVLEGLVWGGRRAAPNVTLRVVPFDPLHVAEDLESGRVDVAIGAQMDESTGLRQRLLFRDDFACVVSDQHPAIRDKVELAHLTEFQHVVVSRDHASFRQVEAVLAERGIERRVALELPYFLLAPALIPVTELILIAPRTLGTLFALGYPLRVLDLPFELPAIREHAYWHARVDADPAHRWLREQLWRCLESFLLRVGGTEEPLVGEWPADRDQKDPRSSALLVDAE